VAFARGDGDEVDEHAAITRDRAMTDRFSTALGGATGITVCATASEEIGLEQMDEEVPRVFFCNTELGEFNTSEMRYVHP
jgi:hypothetical protein